MTEISALERRYRRLLAVYPPAHRLVHGEEMVGVLLAGSRPQQRWPKIADAADLIAGAARIRFRALQGRPGKLAWSDAFALLSVIAPILLLADGLATTDLIGVAIRDARGTPEYPFWLAYWWIWPITFGPAIVTLFALAGWRRSVAVTALLTAAGAAVGDLTGSDRGVPRARRGRVRDQPHRPPPAHSLGDPRRALRLLPARQHIRFRHLAAGRAGGMGAVAGSAGDLRDHRACPRTRRLPRAGPARGLPPRGLTSVRRLIRWRRQPPPHRPAPLSRRRCETGTDNLTRGRGVTTSPAADGLHPTYSACGRSPPEEQPCPLAEKEQRSVRSVMLWNSVPVRFTGLLVAGAVVLAGPAGHGVTSCWQTVPGPAVPVGDSGGLSGVSMSGPGSGWAVGSTLPSSPPGANFRPLLARWDGRRWRATRLPAGATGAGRLDDIAALSASNAWAVGEVDSANSSAPMIIHWNGHRWARVRAAPVPGYVFAGLLGVAVASPGDAWAVGEAEKAAGRMRSVIEHWNGRAWALVPSPNAGTLSGLTDVTVTSNHQAWAVGGSFARTSRALVLRWNGHTWQRAATPRAAGPDLNSVAAVSPNQVWAVGFAEPGNRRLPYALRWNGHTWRSVPVPAGPARDGRELGSVTVLRGGHLAAVGDNLGPSTFGPLHARWNGRRWSVTTGPLNGTGLAAITTDGHSLWAVGSKDQSATRFVPLAQTCHR